MKISDVRGRDVSKYLERSSFGSSNTELPEICAENWLYSFTACKIGLVGISVSKGIWEKHWEKT